jgi:hypothetical protein
MYQMKSTYFGIGIAVLLTALVSCKPDIEYREIIKEVPVEVVIEVPVVDESRINQLINQLNQKEKQHEAQLTEIEERYNAQIQELKNNSSGNTFLFQQIEELEMAHQQEIWETNSNFETEKAGLQNQINIEANKKMEELKEYYNSQYSKLENAYNSKLEELYQANKDNNSLQDQINELDRFYKSKIEEINSIYNSKITWLEELISSAAKAEYFEVSVYRFKDSDKTFLINDAAHARQNYIGFLRNNSRPPIRLFGGLYSDNHHELKRIIEEIEYINADITSILNDLSKDQIAYDYYWDGDDCILWFVVWQFYQYPRSN